MKTYYIFLSLILIISSCNSSSKDLEGKWIDEKGDYFNINSPVDNKIFLVGGSPFIGRVFLSIDKKNKNKYSLLERSGYTYFFYELVIIDNNKLNVTRSTSHDEPNFISGPDITLTLTRVNE